MTVQQIDQELIATHQKLHATTNPVLQYRLIQQIDRLLDQRNKLKK
jgi:TATA-binding protein-associated factor Taf7